MRFIAFALVSATIICGTACHPRPPLKQVSSSARERPINAPDSIARLQKAFDDKRAKEAQDDSLNR